MAERQQPNALDPPFVEGRLLVEIERWDADLHVSLSTDPTAHEERAQGGLGLLRGFQIDGRVVGPKALSGKTVRIKLSPFGAEAQFGPNHLDEVGQVTLHPLRRDMPDLTATLFIPEASMSVVATCLSSIWKFVHIFTFDEDAQRASVSAFGFDAKLHKNVVAWTNQD